MAEPALADPAPPAIKQEHEPMELPGFGDFALPPKRPFEDLERGAHESPEAKRAKMEDQAEEESFEDELALLVQSALSNVGDLVRQSNGAPAASPEPTEADAVPAPESPKPRATFSSDPQTYVRDANLYALGNLALSLLLILAQPPLDETVRLIKDVESDHGRSYRQLQEAFERLRLLYTPKPVLSAEKLDIHESESRTLLELANLAQLGSWLVDGSPDSLSYADQHFLSMFNCQLSDLPAELTDLYLEIMTQRAVESLAVKKPEKPPEEVLGEVLISGLEDRLRGLHGGDELTSADQNFVSSVQVRKETLQGEADEQTEPTALRKKHPLEGLLRTFATYVRGRLKSAPELGEKFGIPIQLDDDPRAPEATTDDGGDGDVDLDHLSSLFEKTASGLVQNALAGLTEDASVAPTMDGAGDKTIGETKTENSPTLTNGKADLMTDYKELEALVAESTSNYVKTTLHGLSPVPYQPTVPSSTAESMAVQLPYLQQLQQHQAQHPYYTCTTYSQATPEPPVQPPPPGEHLPPNQTFPSAVLYDKARQAALSKSSAHTRREGLHSTRRPWTQEEEKALMAGLDMVKGPHWSQILTLFGHNGTMSDILKDRTQVQLKDKARNLKLFFLKTNSEMPYYLQAVTGELKTRAPTQAARKEAEERARLNSEEDQAKLQGIMALAGGLQHPPRQVKDAGGAAASSGDGVAPAQAASAVQHCAANDDDDDDDEDEDDDDDDRGGASTQPAATAAFMSTPTPAPRPAGAPTAQQVLQSLPQAPPRPQAQLPLQAPGPQTQQSPRVQAAETPGAQTLVRGLSPTLALVQAHQAQAQQALAQQAQAQAQAQAQRGQDKDQAASRQPQSAAETRQAQSTLSNVATTTATSTPTLSTQPQQEQEQEQQPQPQTHQLHNGASAPAPPLQQAQPAQPSSAQPTQAQALASVETPETREERHDDDNSAEAALLEGLQAVVAQSLA